jgi:hypothetical protein
MLNHRLASFSNQFASEVGIRRASILFQLMRMDLVDGLLRLNGNI